MNPFWRAQPRVRRVHQSGTGVCSIPAGTQGLVFLFLWLRLVHVSAEETSDLLCVWSLQEQIKHNPRLHTLCWPPPAAPFLWETFFSYSRRHRVCVCGYWPDLGSVSDLYDGLFPTVVRFWVSLLAMAGCSDLTPQGRWILDSNCLEDC